MKFVTRFVRRSAFAFLHKSFNVLVIFAFILQPFGATGFNIRVLAADETAVTTVADAPAEAAAPKEVENPEPVEGKIPAEAPAVVTAKTEAVVPAVEETVPVLDTTKPEVTPATSETPTLEEQPIDGAITPEAAAVSSEAPAQPKETWATDGNKSVTNDSVEIGKTYVAPQNDQVTVTFTNLPENPGTLSIEEITLTDEQVVSLHALSNKAYDITSDMADGTFAYDLTLPKSADQENVQIKFAENTAGLENAETVPSDDVKTENDSVGASLNHFTIFFVVDDGDSNFSAPGWSSYPSGYNGDHQYVTSSQTDKTATWTYPGSAITNGAIFVSWTQWDDHATNAVYNLSTGPTPTVVDQKLNSGQSSSDGNGVWSGWYRLPGTYSITSGSTVTLSTNDSPNGNLSADAVAFVDLNENPANVWVDDNYSENNTGYHFWGYDAFTSIQSAITAVATGGTVNVAAGEYVESGQIVINKNLNIVGAGKLNTIIKPADSTVSPVTTNDLSGWVVVNSGSTFNLSKVTLDGSGKNIAQAIIHHGNGSIDDCSIKNIKFNSQSGVGVRIVSAGTVNVLNTDFSEIGRNGILFKGAATSLIDHNTYTGKGPGSWYDYGIEVQYGANVTITNNTISNNLGAFDGYGSSGVSVWGDPGDTVTFSGNTFTNNTAGIAVAIDEVSGLTFPLIGIGTGNVFNGNDVGVDVQNEGANGTPTVAITGSTFSNNAKSINITADMTASNITVHNSILSGTTASISNNGTGTIDASNNWWGNASGPYDNKTLSGTPNYNNLSGTGSPVTSYVDYKPWCTNTACTTHSSANAVTQVATDVTYTDATLNGSNGDYAATGHSFWVSLSTFSTASPSIPSSVYSTPDFGSIAANEDFSVSLSSIAGILPVTPSTTYHFVAWSLVGGIWYPGAILSFTTADKYTQAEFKAFDGVNIGTNSYTVSSGITATYDNGTGTESNPVLLKLTGYAPIVTPWFDSSWTTYNYVTIGIKLPAGFTGTSVYDAGVMRYNVNPSGIYAMGTGSTDLATAGAASGYLDYSFAANSTNTKKDGLVKLKVIWTEGGAPEYFTIDINGLQLAPNVPTATLTANGVDISTNGYTNSETFTFNLSSADATRYQLKYWNDIVGSSYKESTPWNPTTLGAVYPDSFTQGEGTHYFAFSACNAGNTADNCSAYSSPFVVTYDKTAPAIPGNPSPANQSYVNTHDFTFSWDAVSDPSTPVSYEWEFSYGTALKGDGSFTSRSGFHSLTSASVNSPGTPDNIYYWHVRAIDSLDNASAWSPTWKVTVDNIAPTVDLVFPTSGPSATSFQAVFNEDVNEAEAENSANYFLHNWPGAGGSGDLSGDATVVYNSGTHTATVTFTNPAWYISPEQEWGVENIHDLAGNLQATNPYSKTSTPMVAPVTTDNTDANWHNTPVTVTLTCNDGPSTTGSGCKTTYYTTNGSTPTTASTSGNSVVVSNEGETNIQYFSVDNAGNVETAKTAAHTVKIETVLPESTITTFGLTNGGTIETPTWDGIVAGTATDALSGVDHVNLVIKRNLFVPAPVDEYWNGLAWQASSVKFTANGTNPWNYSLPTPEQGIYTVSSHAVDNAGNEESTYTITIVYDKSIPEVTLAINPSTPNGDNNWYTSEPVITLMANDNNVTDYIEYQLNSIGGAWTTYTGPVTIADGTWQFYYRAVDTTENMSDIGVKNIKVDTKDPDNVDKLDATYKQSPNRVQLTWDVNDSDIDSVYIYRGKSKNFSVNTSSRIAKNNRNDTNYSDDNVTPGEKYYYKVVTIDNAGNKSNVDSISIALPTEGTQAVAVVTNEGTEALPAGTVLGTETTTPDTQDQGSNGEVNNAQTGQVLGEETNVPSEDGGNMPFWQWLLIILVAGGAGYYGYGAYRRNRYESLQ